MKHMLATEESSIKDCMPDEEGPKYPWGLRIHLNPKSMETLGIKLAPVGSNMQLEATVFIQSTEAEETEADGKPKLSMSLQITHMELTEIKKHTADILYDA